MVFGRNCHLCQSETKGVLGKSSARIVHANLQRALVEDVGHALRQTAAQLKRGQRLGQTPEIVAGSAVAQVEVPSDDGKSIGCRAPEARSARDHTSLRFTHRRHVYADLERTDPKPVLQAIQ